MQYYAPDNNRNGKRAGAIALVCYLALFTAVCLLVSFDMHEEKQSEGILIDFGTETDGFGLDNVALSQSEESLSAAQQSGEEEEFLTQDHEEAPAIKTTTAKNNNRQTTVRTNTNNATASNNSTAQEIRKVNRKSLFPGRSTSSDAASQGSSAGSQGNAGNESGGDGSSAGTGTGTEGISFSLSGRRPIGDLPRPSYASNAQGRIVVEITVDAQGNVQTALFSPKGSTTQNASLREAALKAARQTKFTPNEESAVQTGTITYVFKLQ